jgi:hypothetical protein
MAVPITATSKLISRAPQNFRVRSIERILQELLLISSQTGENRWDEKAGLRRDAVRSQVIDVLEAQEIKETGNEEG